MLATHDPQALVRQVYALISGPAGGRDWDRLRTLYLPHARLYPIGLRASGEEGGAPLDLEGWIAGAARFFREQAFHETEIASRLERFDRIAHVFSTYESRHAADDAKPFMRGINSFQLLLQDGRWWVHSVFWQNESDDAPIPSRYLP